MKSKWEKQGEFGLHKFRAKTSKLIIILSVIIGAVFAITIGATYSSLTLSLNVGSNPNSTTTYLAKQEYQVINDSVISPIPFGDGAKLSEVAIEYSYSYDIDVRIQYSLSWSNGADASNVILTMPNRDNFIVDDEYIFVRDAISAGTGKLTVISAVNFVDTSDETYQGASLTINIVDVDVYIASDSASDYTSNHALVQGLNSVAATAWLKYKNQETDTSNVANAYVIAYNYRSDYEHGIYHPNLQTAYYYDTTNSQYVAQYGNRYYAGLSLYVVTGSSPIRLTVRAVGLWRTPSNTNASSDALVFENNIRFNYDSDWVYQSTLDIFDYMYYSYVIPANTAIYIDVLDSIEITSITNLANTDYGNNKMITQLTINSVSFTDFTNGIASGRIATVDNGATTTYVKQTLDIENSGEYNPYLYNLTSASQTTDIPTSILVTNNTSSRKNISLTLTLNAVISNGRTRKGEGNIDFSDTQYWARLEFNSNNYVATQKSFGTYIAPYATVDLFDYYAIGANFYNDLVTASNGSFDAWVYLEVSVTETTVSNSTTNSNLDIIATVNNSTDSSTVEVYVKNNTANVVSNITANVNLTRDVTTYSQLSTQPSDWQHLYWRYYYNDGSGYQLNTNPNFNTQTYYVRNVNVSPITISGNYVASNGFTLSSGTTFTSSTLRLLPGESAKVVEITLSNTVDGLSLSSATASGASASVSTTVEIVNEGTSSAFIVNNSTNSYYIRFAGTLATTDSKIQSTGGYNYYIGIVRPGQVISLSMSAGNNLAVDSILATNEYDDTTNQTITTSWGANIAELYSNYFSLNN